MRFLYESSRERDYDFTLQRNGRHLYMPHFHLNIEIFIVKKGKYDVVCNGKTYTMESGSVAFFDSYDMHSYVKSYTDDVDDCVLIVPPRLMQTYKSWKKNRRVACPVIHDQKLADMLMEIVDKLFPLTQTDCTRHSSVDLLISFIHAKLTYDEKRANDDCALIREILAYIYENFKTDITLSQIAKHLGYTKEHLSRTFHEYINMSIPTYINGLRIEYVAREKRNDVKRNITDLIYEAGFKSVQSYYRNKNRKATGISFDVVKEL